MVTVNDDTVEQNGAADQYWKGRGRSWERARLVMAGGRCTGLRLTTRQQCGSPPRTKHVKHARHMSTHDGLGVNCINWP
jgi:hypothetical protein